MPSGCPYTHPEILQGCSAFQAQLSGRLGLVELRSLPGETKVTLDDPKGTGSVSAVVYGIRSQNVDHLVIILGPDEDQNEKELPGTEVVWTFHPGDPVRPSSISAKRLKVRTITADEAILLGFNLAKVANQ